MPTYATKTPKNYVNPKEHLLYRVFGPGRTKQVAATTTKTEAEQLMESELKALSPSEKGTFVVMRRGSLVASVGLEHLAAA